MQPSSNYGFSAAETKIKELEKEILELKAQVEKYQQKYGYIALYVCDQCNANPKECSCVVK